MNDKHTKLQSTTSDGESTFKVFIITSRARLKNLRVKVTKLHQALRFKLEYIKNPIHIPKHIKIKNSIKCSTDQKDLYIFQPNLMYHIKFYS